MKRTKLVSLIRERKSCLCVGLDSDPDRIPEHLDDDVLQFNKDIIDATRSLCVAYKLNTAFYEAMGSEGWDIMYETISYIGEDHLIIADAKRGDIGNTARQYAKAFFDQLGADAITLSPYMGRDTLQPFLDYNNKWSILLACTSNDGAKDFQKLQANGKYLYEEVVLQASRWGSPEQLMFVAGATQVKELEKIRTLVPNHFLLVPGVGSQGGTVEDVMAAAATDECGLLINASRSIIFAGEHLDFAEKAAEAAADLQGQMAAFITQ
jgi:orotidine-5'-phosphate decarboxylase